MAVGEPGHAAPRPLAAFAHGRIVFDDRETMNTQMEPMRKNFRSQLQCEHLSDLAMNRNGAAGKCRSISSVLFARPNWNLVIQQIWKAVLLLYAAVAISATSVAADKSTRINLGTLAPRGSVYHQSLQAMAETWRQAPGGGVKLVIYPDGTQGGEADMVRLMNVDTLQSGLLTSVGLSKIEPGVTGLQYAPMMFRDLKEFDWVKERMHPQLEKRIADKGYVVLFWVDAGWVKYFSTKPLLMPEDLRKMKIFAWAGSLDQLDIMKKSGYTPVP